MASTDRRCFYNAAIKVNNVTLTDHLESVTIGPFTTNENPAASHGELQDYNSPGTLKVALSANFFQDFAAAKVHATIGPLWSGRTIHDVQIAADGGVAWSGKFFVASYTPAGGARGSQLMAPVTWSPAGALTELAAIG